VHLDTVKRENTNGSGGTLTECLFAPIFVVTAGLGNSEVAHAKFECEVRYDICWREPYCMYHTLMQAGYSVKYHVFSSCPYFHIFI
jgi:hypothetical protein